MMWKREPAEHLNKVSTKIILLKITVTTIRKEFTTSQVSAQSRIYGILSSACGICYNSNGPQ